MQYVFGALGIAIAVGVFVLNGRMARHGMKRAGIDSPGMILFARIGIIAVGLTIAATAVIQVFELVPLNSAGGIPLAPWNAIPFFAVFVLVAVLMITTAIKSRTARRNNGPTES